MQAKTGAQPACLRGRCDIEEIASDLQVNQLVDRFRLARAIYQANEVETLYIEQLREIGLLDEPELLLELEVVYQEQRRRLLDDAARKRKQK